MATYCESQKGNLKQIVEQQGNADTLRKKHLSGRAKTEKHFFDRFCRSVDDRSNPVFIEKGEINDPHYVQEIINLDPDMIISYGCSIIRSELLAVFQRRFINIHLGLSPYYRGSGTNFWPFVNNELQFVGTTFMHIDHGVDTGEIIHQIRADIHSNDTIHQIGNRLIKDSFEECVKLIKTFDKIHPISQISINKDQERYYRNKDFTENSLVSAYANMSNKLVEHYLENKESIDEQFPIIKNPIVLSL